jgi:outer membrane protein TolC
VFSFEEYLDLITTHHPIAIQNDLMVAQSDAAVLKARGEFDPKLFFTRSNKEFESKDYYDIRNAGLKIPTWFGAEVKAGYEYNNGQYLNPENNVTANGVSYLGVSVPLGQGLFLDERRATLRKAQAFQEQTEQERIILLNELYFKSIEAYLSWSKSFAQMDLYRDAVEASKRRYDAYRSSFKLGAIPAIDTLEALIQYQNRQLTALEYQGKFIKSSNVLNTYLWFEGTTPLELSDSLIPETISNILMDMDSARAVFLNLDQEIVGSPALKFYDFKLQQLQIDRRLSYEMLKPKIDLNYNFLSRDLSAPDIIFENNYKWGLNLSVPLLFRKGRGEYQKAKFKLATTEQQRDLKLRSVKTKLNGIYRQLEVLGNQSDLYEKNATNYQNLLGAERTKLSIGESSLFKLNAREIKWLESQSKLLEVQVKQRLLYYSLFQQLGTIR